MFITELFYLYLPNKLFVMQQEGRKGITLKKVVIALFIIEQVIIIYIIATRKGMSVIDWLSNIF